MTAKWNPSASWPAVWPTISRISSLETEFSKNLPAIAGDPAQIGQAVSNLVKNGVEAMCGKGLMSIRTRKAILKPEDCLQHGNARPGHFAVLSVSDSGPGIPAQILPNIYDPFFSTKKGGGNSGFGLAVVYTIARDHGGWIDVTSEVGKGACGVNPPEVGRLKCGDDPVEHLGKGTLVKI